MSNQLIKIHPNDNVEVDVKTSETFAAKEIGQGRSIVLYGMPVAVATRTIKAGSAFADAGVRTICACDMVEETLQPQELLNANSPQHKTFKGYYRKDGSVGTANYWLVIPLVFCENRNVEVMRDAMLQQLGYQRCNKYGSLIKSLVTSYNQHLDADELLKIHTEEINFNKQDILFPNVDGIRFLTHQGGCGGTRQDANALCGLFAGYITHPNVAGATVLSLGCQNAQTEILLNEIKKRDAAFDKPLYILDQQQTGEEQDLISSAIAQTLEGLKEANKNIRTDAPLSKLCIGLESGKQNNFFINAAVGKASDMFIRLGASLVLAQLPLLKNVEQQVIKRCIKEENKNRLIELINKYTSSAQKNSWQNIVAAAGILAKAGNAQIRSVLDFTDKISSSGLSVLCTPDDNIISLTAQAGSGANIILCTAGNANEDVNNPITPVIKISDNNSISEKNDAGIHLDLSTFFNEKNSLEKASEALTDRICSVASGGVKNNGIANEQYDFIPWKRGISL